MNPNDPRFGQPIHNDENCICVYDFAGNQFQSGCWADYYVDLKETRFGGAWCNVPDMPGDTLPEEEEVIDWARKYSCEQ